MFTLHFHIERWKKRADLGILISTDGRIKDIHTKKIIQPKINGNGYYFISINNENYKVHRLVAQTFLGNIDNMTIDHLDGNRRNNKLSNLEIVSFAENIKRAKNNFVRLDEDIILQSVQDNGLSAHEVISAIKFYKKEIINKKIVAATVEEFYTIAKKRGVNIPSDIDAEKIMDRIRIKALANETYMGIKLSMEDNNIVGYIS